MKIKPIKDIDLCEQVRFNNSVTGNHLYVRSGTPNQDKKEFALCSIISMMVQRGLVTKNPNESLKKSITRAIKEANNLVGDFSLDNSMRM